MELNSVGLKSVSTFSEGGVLKGVWEEIKES